MNKKWSDISIGDVFTDGSKVTAIHDRYFSDCYKIEYRKKKGFIKDLARKICVLSSDHLLLIDISRVTLAGKQWIEKNFANYEIPTSFDKNIYLDEKIKIESIEDTVIETSPSRVSKYEFWLPIKLIVDLICTGEQLICNDHIILSIEYVGEREVFCVQTDTNRFETCGLIHHNSVTLRNIILHNLTHGEDIATALIDLKQTEFESYKGLKNVVAVANDVREAVEILRIMREVMYSRNREMAKLGINDIKDFVPKEPTERVMIFNHEMEDSDEVEIKNTNGEIKTVTVKELEGYL